MQQTVWRQFGERLSASFVNIHNHRDGQFVITVNKRRDADIVKLASAFAICHSVFPAGSSNVAGHLGRRKSLERDKVGIVAYWHLASFRCVAKLVAYWANN